MSVSRMFLPLLLLAGCGQADEDGASREAARAADGIAPEDRKVDCAIGGETMARDCTIERSRGQEGTVLTLRHPDGGFRRLLVATDGRGVVAADGAEPAEVTALADDRIEVSIAGDRYLLPATVRPAAAPGQ